MSKSHDHHSHVEQSDSRGHVRGETDPHHGEHSHGHHHHHHNVSGRALGISIALNLFITLAQAIGGFLSGSLSLLSDALHNFSDVVALVVSWVAHRLTKRAFCERRTFGYMRAEIIAALINGVTLLGIAVNLIIEAAKRLHNPEPVGAKLVLILAGLSIVVNGVSVLLIKEDSEHNLNMRSAYLHLFTDMLTSVAVLAGGLAMYSLKVYWVDPVLALLISLYLSYNAYQVLREGLGVVMHFTPEGVDIPALVRRVEQESMVKNMHHVHVWRLTDSEIHMKAHVDFSEDFRLSEVTQKVEALEVLLREEFGITHLVLQAEYGAQDCKDIIVSEHPHEK